ncbi:MAG: DNA internalization-related competence protein ComEC/Rec2 [Firmicutes bacterium HGW-Firmicutes-8]|nr:MAG: DNA internalization-related competence protein ComEC/Rec2 [Firmicutes bacterium HGW-Firmicutes-8]
MTRPILTAMVSYAAGILAGQYFDIPVIFLYFTGALVLLLGLYHEASGWQKNRLYFCLALVALGIIMVQWQDERNKGNIEFLADQRVLIIGSVAAEPDVRLNAANYTVKVEELVERDGESAVESSGEPVRGRILLTVAGPAPQYSYGDRLEISGIPMVPKEPGNPGEFNYREYLKAKGIQLIIKSRQGAGVQKTGTGSINPVVDVCLKIKVKLMAVIDATMSRQHAGLLAGILFGSGGRIDPGARNDFALTGVVHILSVSGYHMGLLVAFCVLCGNILQLNKTGRNILMVLVTSFYAVMTGASPPVVRALVMAWVLLLARHSGGEYDWPNSLSLAALVILLYDPRALFNPGFQLSFTATWGILYLAPLWRGLPKLAPAGLLSAVTIVSQALAITVSAQAAIFPITSYYFNYISLVSLPANLIIVPLISLVMILGGFAALGGLLWLPLGGTVNFSTGLILDLILRIARFLAGLPFAVVTVKQPSIVQIAAFYVITVISIEAFRNPEIWLRLRRRWSLHRTKVVPLILAIVAAILWTSIVSPAGSGKLEVTFLDIGQGDAVLIQSPDGRSIIIDTGGVQGSPLSAYNPGEKILVPYLRRKGISKIDLLVLSHAHADHIQGAEALVKSMGVNMLVVAPQFDDSSDGSRLLNSFTEKGIQIKEATGGEKVLFDEKITLEVLSPPGNAEAKENDNSLVVRLCFGELHILFTGDVGETVLQKLADYPVAVHAEIVKVPHHGSKSGWLERFYRVADPEMAVISVGPNYFGHPSREVLNGLSGLNIPVFRTDKNGAVIVRSDGSDYQVETVKDQ